MLLVGRLDAAQAPRPIDVSMYVCPKEFWVNCGLVRC